jgi:hypothetical protein
MIRSSKTVIAASGFTYVFGCQQLRWLSHRSCWQLKNVCKTRGCNYSFWAPDDGRFIRSSKTVIAASGFTYVIKKHWNNKFYYTVASCWSFLWDLKFNVSWQATKCLNLVLSMTFILRGTDPWTSSLYSDQHKACVCYRCITASTWLKDAKSGKRISALLPATTKFLQNGHCLRTKPVTCPCLYSRASRIL